MCSVVKFYRILSLKSPHILLPRSFSPISCEISLSIPLLILSLTLPLYRARSQSHFFSLPPILSLPRLPILIPVLRFIFLRSCLFLFHFPSPTSSSISVFRALFLSLSQFRLLPPIILSRILFSLFYLDISLFSTFLSSISRPFFAISPSYSLSQLPFLSLHRFPGNRNRTSRSLFFSPILSRSIFRSVNSNCISSSLSISSPSLISSPFFLK